MVNVKQNNLKNIPNILTVFRIILTPFIIALIFINSDVVYSYSFLGLNNSVSITFLISGILFVIACISDFLDGYLARKNKWISDFGKIWDPIADKVLTTSIYICFSIINLIPFYFVILMVIRDIVVDAYRQSATKKGIVTPANFFGKLKTVLQMSSILLIYFVFNYKPNTAYTTNNVAFYLIQNLFVIFATFASLTSSYIYVMQIKKAMKKLGNNNDKY